MRPSRRFVASGLPTSFSISERHDVRVPTRTRSDNRKEVLGRAWEASSSLSGRIPVNQRSSMVLRTVLLLIARAAVRGCWPGLKAHGDTGYVDQCGGVWVNVNRRQVLSADTASLLAHKRLPKPDA
jgi:hypothetical protein